MRFIKILIPIIFLCLFACQEKVKELPGAPPIANEEKPKVPIFTSDNVKLEKVKSLEKYRDSLSYSVGMYLANNFAEQDLQVKPQIIAQGYMDVMTDQAGLSHRSATNYIGRVKNIQVYRMRDKSGKFKFPLSLDSISYAIGIDMGHQQKGTDYELNINPFHQGLYDAQSKATAKVNEKDQARLMGLFVQGMQSVIKKRKEGKSTVELEKELAFFEENRKTPGLSIMPSGLQFQVIKPGLGPNALYTDRLIVNYVVKDITGKVLDDTFKKERSAKVNISEMIPGWVEGLQLMNEGANFRFFVPSRLAYGEDGYKNIPPNTALIYEIQLIDILSKNKK